MRMASKKLYARGESVHTTFAWYDGSQFVIAEVDPEGNIVRRRRSVSPPPVEREGWTLVDPDGAPDAIQAELEDAA